MEKLQNNELVKLMGGQGKLDNVSNYTLAGATVIWDSKKGEQKTEEDSEPCEDDVF